MESPAHRRHASRTDGSAEMITAAQAAQIYGHASRTDLRACIPHGWK